MNIGSLFRAILSHRRGGRRKDTSVPPRLADWILYLTLPDKTYECIRGDLTEEYQALVLPRLGIRKARLWYWQQVLRSIGPAMRGEIVYARRGSEWRESMMETVLQDLRYGVRTLL